MLIERRHYRKRLILDACLGPDRASIDWNIPVLKIQIKIQYVKIKDKPKDGIILIKYLYLTFKP